MQLMSGSPILPWLLKKPLKPPLNYALEEWIADDGTSKGQIT